MAWILLEGLDRSGKSSVAEYYKDQGYEVVHMNAPDKKYFEEGYAGESYLEELVRMYTKYGGRDVVFDRTIYGELVWPNVYGRLALLEEEDVEYLAQIERNNDAEKILMFDSNTEAHWQRCVENNEPLNRQQFGRASVFYERLYNEYGFIKKQLSDFPELMPEGAGSDDGSGALALQQSVGGVSEHGGDTTNNGSVEASSKMGNEKSLRDESESSGVLGSTQDSSALEDKLERANAIRVLLSGKIVKKKGEIYNDLDEAIRGFLHTELDKIFNPPKPQGSTVDFSEDEVRLLKALANTMKRKQES